jgi:hypothetical protein
MPRPRKSTAPQTQVPGDTAAAFDEQADDAETDVQAAAQQIAQPQSVSAGMPAFRSMHSTQAAQWFADNPSARRLPVECSDGWYVPEDAFARAQNVTK